MTKKTTISITILSIALFLFWATRPQELSEEAKQWKADKDAYNEYIVYVNEVREAVAEEMFQELDLILSGGSGRMHGKAEVIGMQFQANRRATIEEARMLQLIVMEDLIEKINTHEKLRPFLKEFPFTYERIKVELSFEGPTGTQSDGTVAYMFNVYGIYTIPQNSNHIFYRSYDPFFEKLVHLQKEHYEEALQRAAEMPIRNPRVHQTTPLEEITDKALVAFAEKIKNEHKMYVQAIGAKQSDHLEEIGATFLVFQRATQEEARKLLLTIQDKLLDAINQNEELKPYLNSPFSIDNLRIRILFRRKGSYKYRDGSMESVTLESDKVNYFNRDNNEPFLVNPPPFATETYEEAKLRASKT